MHTKFVYSGILCAMMLGCAPSNTAQTLSQSTAPPPPTTSQIYAKAVAIEITDRRLFSTATQRPFFIENASGICSSNTRNQNVCRSSIKNAVQSFGFRILDQKTTHADFNAIVCRVDRENINLYTYKSKYNRRTPKYSTICNYTDGLSGRVFAKSQGFSVPERERDTRRAGKSTLFDVAIDLTELAVGLASIPVVIGGDALSDAYQTIAVDGIQHASKRVQNQNVNNVDQATLIMLKGIKNSVSQSLNLPWGAVLNQQSKERVVEANGFDDGIVSNRPNDFREAIKNALSVAAQQVGVRVRVAEGLSEKYSGDSYSESQYSNIDITGDAYIKDFYVLQDFGYGPDGYKVRIRAIAQLN